MSSVWLLCAARSNVRELTEEVERRCPRAQLMRMGCEQGISDVARVLLQVAVGAAVSFDEPATAQRVVRELVGLERSDCGSCCAQGCGSGGEPVCRGRYGGDCSRGRGM